ncbi:plastocyanin/azurin family copper-binding protein [Halobacterium zhouii]|uniref:plastocyanin/azurin family copper-binding protein n=1 Tax=Halobacterium zhouii TaxID=2902624 RepID=UPI001E58E6B8|nr:plastocyanin/azurin family copper-binding protein [Halobacterium zhouii]
MGEHVSRRQFLRSLGGAGGLAATTSAAAAQDEQSTATVAMTDDLVYQPETVTVAPGTTVVWENVGNIAHTVTAYSEEIPENAPYFASGGPFDSEQAARAAYPDQGVIPGGETYEHTFETTGSFGYFCIPHESAGMIGTVEVTENPGAGGGGGGGSILPNSAKTLGVVATSVLVVVLGFAWAFVKYGGDYGDE